MFKSFKSSIVLFFRKQLLKRKGVIIHNNCTFSGVEFSGKAVVEPYCRLNGDPKIIIGDNFYMNAGCHLQGNIIFGRDVMIGPKTVMWGRDHAIELSEPMCNQGHIKSDIIVGDDVWIGANVTIIKGLNIGTGSVIGAGSVVVRDIPEYAIAVGNPARVVKSRKPEHPVSKK